MIENENVPERRLSLGWTIVVIVAVVAGWTAALCLAVRYGMSL